MTALTSGRNTPIATGDARQGSGATGQKIFAGALVMHNAAGSLVKGVTGLNLTGLNLTGAGRAGDLSDNTAGADGDLSLACRPGLFRFANDGADTVTIAGIGLPCYAVDDQTVASSDGTGPRPKAGIAEMPDSQGVRVSFSEAVTRAAT